VSEAAVSTNIRFVHQPDFPIKEDHPLRDEFGLPGLAPHGSVILMFKVSGIDGSRLDIANKTAHATHALVPNPIKLDTTFAQPRAWFEVIAHDKFAEFGNNITMKLADPVDGKEVTVSDVVIFYVTPTPEVPGA
jgi:hypothetical protein